MKVCVFGAGAIGGHLAARLAQGGAEVSVVARGAHLAAMREHGLRVEAPDGTLTARVAAAAEASAFGPQDAVVVTVKAPALPSVAVSIAPLLGPDTPVAFVINGIPWWYFHRHGGDLDGRELPLADPGGALWQRVGPKRALGGVVYSACTVIAPGVVRVEGRSRLVLGEPDGRLSPRLEALAAPLRAGGLRVDATEDIRHAVWTKLMLNLSTGPFCVLTQAGQNAAMAEPAAGAAAMRVLEEGRALAAAMGHALDFNADRLIAGNAGMVHKPSIVQDLELGRPMEVDVLFGLPLELARLRGVPTPTLDLLVALVRARAKAAGLYGS